MEAHVVDFYLDRLIQAELLLRESVRLLNRMARVEGALQTVYHRLLDTLAEEWVSPNPTASARCAMAQYEGGLCEFILGVLDE